MIKKIFICWMIFVDIYQEEEGGNIVIKLKKLCFKDHNIYFVESKLRKSSFLRRKSDKVCWCLCKKIRGQTVFGSEKNKNKFYEADGRRMGGQMTKY